MGIREEKIPQNFDKLYQGILELSSVIITLFLLLSFKSSPEDMFLLILERGQGETEGDRDRDRLQYER